MVQKVVHRETLYYRKLTDKVVDSKESEKKEEKEEKEKEDKEEEMEVDGAEKEEKKGDDKAITDEELAQGKHTICGYQF